MTCDDLRTPWTLNTDVPMMTTVYLAEPKGSPESDLERPESLKHWLINFFLRKFPGGPVVENPPANAGETGSIPGPGGFHTLWSESRNY